MQDKAFVQIGKIALQNLGDKKPYQLFIQNMFPEKDNYLMIVAVFNFSKNNEDYQCSFHQIDPQITSSLSYEKYAYRKGSSRGGDITFTTKFGDIEKKFRTLVDNQLKTLVSKLNSSELAKEAYLFNKLLEFLSIKENFDLVKNKLSEYYDSLEKENKNTSGLSIMLNIDGFETYLADFEIIQQILSASGTEEKSQKYGVISEGKNQSCSICCEKKAVLHGFASPFKYATVDKPGMVSGFFKQENNWKNYPICTDCSLAFELGRSFITSNLSGYFYGKAYYCIPKTLISNDLVNLEKATERLSNLYKKPIEDASKITFKEDSLQRLIAKESDYFNINLLFYEENPTTKAIKIKLLLEEIVPSRFKHLFVDIPEKINDNPIYFKSIIIEKKLVDLKFNFGILKLFFDDNFYEIIYHVFTLQPISEESLYISITNVLLSKLNKSESVYHVVLKAHLIINYLRELNILPQIKNTLKNMEIIENVVEDEKVKYRKYTFDDERISNFLENQNNFFGENGNPRKGVFLVGSIVRILLAAQADELDGNTPFEKKLKGYSLNSNGLIEVYEAAYEKLKLYKEKEKYYFPEKLYEYSNQYYNLNIELIKKMTKSEISFFFISGMQLIDELRTIKK